MRGVRLIGPHSLFFAAAVVTIALLLWTNQWRLGNDNHALSAIFFVQFVNDYQGAAVALLTLVIAFLGSQHLPVKQCVQWLGERPRLIAASVALVLAIGSLVIYHNHPLSMDEYAACFQSRVFAAGRLHGSFPTALLNWLIPRDFQNYFLNVSQATGSVTETYWPGFALLLTPFTWAGATWLCNPILSAGTLLVIHRLALNLFEDRDAASFALMLTVASPVIFANGISFYSMPAHLLANSLFALLLLRPTLLRAAAAG